MGRKKRSEHHRTRAKKGVWGGWKPLILFLSSVYLSCCLLLSHYHEHKRKATHTSRTQRQDRALGHHCSWPSPIHSGARRWSSVSGKKRSTVSTQRPPKQLQSRARHSFTLAVLVEFQSCLCIALCLSVLGTSLALHVQAGVVGWGELVQCRCLSPL